VQYGDEASRWLSTHGSEAVIGLLAISLVVALSWFLKRRATEAGDEPFETAAAREPK
jgi:hypothetical protein